MPNKQPFFSFLNVASEKDDAVLSIHDEIGFWGTTSRSFHENMKAIVGKKLEVHINSPGGNVVHGYAIYNMLRAFKGDVTVVVDGMAASIASVIAMAGKTIKMPENALMVIHDPLIQGVTGNAEELRKHAEQLDKLGEGILAIYEARTGADRAKIKKLMADDTLLTSKECQLLGFCDEILPENRAAAKANFVFADYFPNITLPTGAIPVPAGADRTKDNDMKTLEEATARIAVLEGEARNHVTVVADAKKAALQEATNAVTTAENTRKNGIKALATKHNKDGDLNAITVDALAGTSTVEEFKDKVLEVVAARPATAAAKRGTADIGGAEGSDAELSKEYDALKLPSERRAFCNKNRAWARKMASS